MASDLEQLLEFGFPENKAKKALKATSNSGLQAALDWLDVNGENEALFVEEEEKKQTCLMCGNCKKKFKSLEQAELHAGRTGHDDYQEAEYEESEFELGSEESAAPMVVLTEEQKAARLAELRAKVAQKKAEKEKEAKEAEVLRKSSTKELEQIRRDMQAKEMKKLAEERRMEKIEDRKRREQIKKQIEEDRANLKRQRDAERGIWENVVEASADANEVTKIVVTSSNSSSIARIQVRLPGPNPPLKLTFESPQTETLMDLKERILKEAPAVKKVKELLQTFPTRVFGPGEDCCTLSELGLAPSATLILQ